MAIDARYSAVFSAWFRHTRRRNWKPAGFLLLVMLGLAACEGPTEENGFVGNPAVWPQASRLGDSVGWLLSSESLFGLQAASIPFFSWSCDNVKIGLVDEQDHEVILVPRVVFEVQSAMGAQIRGGSHEANIGAMVAMFDLPDPWPNASNPAPPVLDLVLDVGSQAVPHLDEHDRRGIGHSRCLSAQRPSMGTRLNPYGDPRDGHCSRTSSSDEAGPRSDT
jgi:hypothetical protein